MSFSFKTFYDCLPLLKCRSLVPSSLLCRFIEIELSLNNNSYLLNLLCLKAVSLLSV